MKHAAKKNKFLDDFNRSIGPDAAFIEDTEPDGDRRSQGDAHFKVRVRDGLGLPKKSSRVPTSTPRFFHKSYVKRFEDAQRVLALNFSNEPEGTEKILLEPEDAFEARTIDEDNRQRETVKELNERLRENPNDGSLWLKLVDNDQKETVEKKLAVLKAASEKNPKSSALAVKRLELSREILPTSVLDRQWKELVVAFAGDFDAWSAYLNFVTSYFTSFSVDKVNGAYAACLQKMRTSQSSASKRCIDVEDRIRGCLVDFCYFSARSGFREKAVAIFQAVVELNLFSPEFSSFRSLDDKLALFEPFWESGVARFGETNALGWDEVMRRKRIDDCSTYERDDGCQEEDRLVKEAGNLVDKSRLWLEMELGRERRHWLPFRSGENDAEDPERSVAFDDVAPFLIEFMEAEQVFFWIVDFLNFLGVRFSEEAFFHSPFYSRLSGDNRDVDIDFAALQRTSPHPLEDSNLLTFCRNVFESAMKRLPSAMKTELAALRIRFETTVIENNCDDKKAKVKLLKQTVQAMLAEDKSNFVLYAEFARAVMKVESFKKSWSIVESTLQSAHGDAKLFVLMTAFGIVLTEMLRNDRKDPELIDKVILLASRILKPTSTSPLATSKMDLMTLAEEIRLAGSNWKVNDARKAIVSFTQKEFVAVFALAWLNYVTSDVETAVKAVDDYCGRSNDDYIIEHCHKLRLDLLFMASQTDSRQLRIGRQRLSDAIRRFPNNIYFVGLLNDFRVQPTLVDKTWRRLSATLATSKTMAKVEVARFLLRRSLEDSSSSSLQKANSLLERVAFGSFSPALWRLLLWTSDKKMMTFHRALQECPTAKALHLDLAAYLSDEDAEEKRMTTLTKALDALMEKGGRVRLPIEELDILLQKEDDD